MPIRDQAAMELSLDNDYGPTRGPNAADSLEAVLFCGDPDDDGVEVPTDVDLVSTGYARVTFSNDDWLLADEGVKESLPIAFPSAESEWPDTVTHIAFRDPVTGYWWDSVPLAEELDITSAGPGPVVTAIIYYDNNLD